MGLFFIPHWPEKEKGREKEKERERCANNASALVQVQRERNDQVTHFDSGKNSGTHEERERCE